jgi:hypothetical protein
MILVFWIIEILVKRGRLEGISEKPLLPLRGSSVSGIYVIKRALSMYLVTCLSRRSMITLVTLVLINWKYIF